MAKNIIGIVKVRNSLKNEPNLELVNASNIRINGVLKGCSGFIVNKDTNKCVYFTTEHSVLDSLGFMYREAFDTKSYGGTGTGPNTWEKSFDGLINSIVKTLNNPKIHFNEQKEWRWS